MFDLVDLLRSCGCSLLRSGQKRFKAKIACEGLQIPILVQLRHGLEVEAALCVNQSNGSSWSGFTRLGQTTVGNPSCTTLGGGKVLCAVVGVNNKVSSIVGP